MGKPSFAIAGLRLIPIPRKDEAAPAGRESSGNQQAMEAAWQARESIPEAIWPVGQCALFAEKIGPNRNVWIISRGQLGWIRRGYWRRNKPRPTL